MRLMGVQRQRASLVANERHFLVSFCHISVCFSSGQHFSAGFASDFHEPTQYQICLLHKNKNKNKAFKSNTENELRRLSGNTIQ